MVKFFRKYRGQFFHAIRQKIRYFFHWLSADRRKCIDCGRTFTISLRQKRFERSGIPGQKRCGRSCPNRPAAKRTEDSWRDLAHRYLDYLWEIGILSREECYELMQQILHKDKWAAHISMLTELECRDLVLGLKAKLPAIYLRMESRMPQKFLLKLEKLQKEHSFLRNEALDLLPPRMIDLKNR